MSNEPLILSIETATLSGSIAISRGAEILGDFCGDPSTSHSNTLLADIDRLLMDLGLTIRDIDLFAVAAGPGSFTGLRIGIASVKALAVTLDRPCVGVPTLAAIARAAGESKCSVGMLPAGRGEVFAQMFEVSADGAVTALDDPVHLPPAKVVERYLNQVDVRWVGDGATQHDALINEQGTQLARSWTIARINSNLARDVAQLARDMISTLTGHTATDLRALYVRPSDAELKY